MGGFFSVFFLSEIPTIHGLGVGKNKNNESGHLWCCLVYDFDHFVFWASWGVKSDGWAYRCVCGWVLFRQCFIKMEMRWIMWMRWLWFKGHLSWWCVSDVDCVMCCFAVKGCDLMELWVLVMSWCDSCLGLFPTNGYTALHGACGQGMD